MELQPSKLLKKASTEEDEVLQAEYISKALSHINEFLPFSHRNKHLAEDRELLRYLMLLLPCYGSIDFVINSMLFKFQKNNQFLVSFQQSLESIASFSDNWKEIVENTAVETGNSNLGSRMSSSLTRTKPTNIASILRRINLDFNSRIKDNILNLKKAALLFAKKLYDLFEAHLRSKTFDPRKDKVLFELISPLNLARIFLQFTENKELIFGVHNMLLDYKGVREYGIEGVDLEEIYEMIRIKTSENYSEQHSKGIKFGSNISSASSKLNATQLQALGFPTCLSDRILNEPADREQAWGSKQEYFGKKTKFVGSSTPKALKMRNTKNHGSHQNLPSVIFEEQAGDICSKESLGKFVGRSIEDFPSPKMESASLNKSKVKQVIIFRDALETHDSRKSSFCSLSSGHETDGFTEALESWLICVEAAPIVEKNEEIKAFLSYFNCFVVLIGLIVDPFLYKTSFNLAKFFRASKSSKDCLDIYFHKEDPLKMKATNYGDPKEKNPYYFRAQLATQVLTCPANYGFFNNLYPNIVNVLFEQIYTALKTPSCQGDIQHFIHLMSYFIARNPKEGLKSLFRFHLLFGLLLDVEYSFVREFFLRILSPSDSFFGFHQKARNFIWRYCEASGFFPEMAQQMLAPKRLSELEKFDFAFKMSELNLIQQEILDQNDLGESLYLETFTREFYKDKTKMIHKKKPIFDIDQIEAKNVKKTKEETISAFPESETSITPPKNHKPIKRNLKSLKNDPSGTQAAFILSGTSLKRKDKSKSPENEKNQVSLEKIPSLLSLERKKVEVDRSQSPKTIKSERTNLTKEGNGLFAKDMKNTFHFGRPPSIKKEKNGLLSLELINEKESSTVNSRNTSLDPQNSQKQPKIGENHYDMPKDSKSMRQMRVILWKTQATKEGAHVSGLFGKQESGSRVNSMDSLKSADKRSSGNKKNAKKIDLRMLEGNLYPLSQATFKEIEIEIKNKSLSMLKNKVNEIEEYSAHISEIIYYIVSSAVENDIFAQAKIRFGSEWCNSNSFWQAFLISSDARTLDSVLKTFLGKLASFLSDEQRFVDSSAHFAAKTVNFILKHLEELPYLRRSKHVVTHKAINQLSQIVKTIILLNECKTKKMSFLRLELASTFIFLAKNDVQIKSFDRVPGVVFQILQNWFYEYKTNSAYHHLFCRFIHFLLADNSYNSRILVLFRMSALSFLYNVSSQIFLNGLRLDFHESDSLVFHISEIVKTLFFLASKDPELEGLVSQTQSWNLLVQIYGYRLGIKSKGIMRKMTTGNAGKMGKKKTSLMEKSMKESSIKRGKNVSKIIKLTPPKGSKK